LNIQKYSEKGKNEIKELELKARKEIKEHSKLKKKVTYGITYLTGM
jgi:hypothetical protein